MVGEATALGCRDGCRQEGGWSTGRRRCRLQSFPPPESRGVIVTARGDEMVSFGSLIDVMKSHTVITLEICEIHLAFGSEVYLCTEFYRIN